MRLRLCAVCALAAGQERLLSLDEPPVNGDVFGRRCGEEKTLPRVVCDAPSGRSLIAEAHYKYGFRNPHAFGVSLGETYEPRELIKFIMGLEVNNYRAATLHGALWTAMGKAVKVDDIVAYALDLCGDMTHSYSKWWNCAHAIGHGVYAHGVAREEEAKRKEGRRPPKLCDEPWCEEVAFLVEPLSFAEKLCLELPRGPLNSCSDGLFMSFMDKIKAQTPEAHLPITFCAHRSLSAMCVSKVGTVALEKRAFGDDVNGTGACADQDTAWASHFCKPSDFTTHDKLKACAFGMGDALSRAHHCFDRVPDVTACSGFGDIAQDTNQAQELAAACIAGTRHMFFFHIFEHAELDRTPEDCYALCERMASHPDPTIRSIGNKCHEFTPCAPETTFDSWDDAYPGQYVPL